MLEITPMALFAVISPRQNAANQGRVTVGRKSVLDNVMTARTKLASCAASQLNA